MISGGFGCDAPGTAEIEKSLPFQNLSCGGGGGGGGSREAREARETEKRLEFKKAGSLDSQYFSDFWRLLDVMPQGPQKFEKFIFKICLVAAAAAAAAAEKREKREKQRSGLTLRKRDPWISRKLP